MKFELFERIGFEKPKSIGKYASMDEANDAAWDEVGKKIDQRVNSQFTTKTNRENSERQLIVSNGENLLIYIIRKIA